MDTLHEPPRSGGSLTSRAVESTEIHAEIAPGRPFSTLPAGGLRRADGPLARAHGRGYNSSIERRGRFAGRSGVHELATHPRPGRGAAAGADRGHLVRAAAD